MKTLFIESKYMGKTETRKIKVEKLPQTIGLATSVQFADRLDEIKNFLETNNKKVLIGEGKQKYKGQILGCDVSAGNNIKGKVDAFLYIGDGRFHPLGLAMKTEKEVYTFNPKSNQFLKINEKKINEYKKNIQVKTMRYLSSDNIGILVSTKPGQNDMKSAQKLKKDLEKKGKKGYIFVFNTLNTNELENFPFVDFWVNTACPRIEEDSKKIINIENI